MSSAWLPPRKRRPPWSRTPPRTAQLRSEEILRQAQADAVEIKNKADADIAQQRKKAINEVKDEIGGIAMDIASKVVEREIDQQAHQDLIDEFIPECG